MHERHQGFGTLSFEIVHPINDNETISFEKQKLYCKGVGMLLYFVKHLLPYIANTVREPSKGLDGFLWQLTRNCIKFTSMFWIQKI